MEALQFVIKHLGGAGGCQKYWMNKNHEDFQWQLWKYHKLTIVNQANQTKGNKKPNKKFKKGCELRENI